MIIAITGHTRGLGKYLFEYFTKKGYQTNGYSRSSGYDFSKIEAIHQVFKESDNCTVFINSAYDYYSNDNFQSAILKLAYDKWNNLPKHIFNIGSISSELVAPIEGHPGGHRLYISNKLEQDRLCEEIARKSHKCKIKVTNLRLGLIERIPERINNCSPTIPLLYIADTIVNIIESPAEINSVTIRSKRS